jgi:sugar phosphate isomerase/epimerase
LRAAGYDDALSIEQEDPYASQEDGVREAAAFIQTELLSAARA